MRLRSLIIPFVALILCVSCFGQSRLTEKASSIFGAMADDKKAEYQKQAIRLWEGRAPHAKGNEPADIPLLYPVLPSKGDKPTAAMLVLTGGGYRVHSSNESFPIAEGARSSGMAAFVLEYRLGNSYTPDQILADAQRAVRLIRARAVEFNVDPAKICVIGFSAGGHLAANLCAHADDGIADASDQIERQSCRLQAAILVYPVIINPNGIRPNGAKQALTNILAMDGLHNQVTCKTPPTFLVVGFDDHLAPYEHCLAYAAKLHEAGVRFELHILGAGGHGRSTREQNWAPLSYKFLSTCGLIPPAKP